MNDKELLALAKAGRKRLKSLGEGLYFRVEGVNRANWCFRYQHQKKRHMISLGKYGKAKGDLTLANAGVEAAKLTAMLREGLDPIIELNRSQLVNLVTVSEVGEDYLSQYCLRIKNPQIPHRIFSKEIEPHIGSLNMVDVRPGDIMALLRKIRQSDRPTIANDTLLLIKKIFNHGIKLGLTQSNPAAALDIHDAGGAEKSRARILKITELSVIFSILRQQSKQFTRQNYLAFALFLVTAVRKSELMEAPWKEFDLDACIWHIPAERTKTGVPIDIPLPAPAVEWLLELRVHANRSDYVFPSRKQNSSRPFVSPDTLNHALGKLFGMKVAPNKKPFTNFLGDAGIEHFVIHDLRRTVKTLLSANRVPPHISERCLNHKIKGVEGIYDRHDYFEERKEAMEALALQIAPIVNSNSMPSL